MSMSNEYGYEGAAATPPRLTHSEPRPTLLCAGVPRRTAGYPVRQYVPKVWCGVSGTKDPVQSIRAVILPTSGGPADKNLAIYRKVFEEMRAFTRGAAPPPSVSPGSTMSGGGCPR